MIYQFWLIPIAKKKKKINGGKNGAIKVFFSSHTGNSRGIAILFNNTFPFTLHNEIYDKNGNYLILDVSIQECRMTLAALYGPNEDSPNFYTHLQEMITSLQNSSIIMVGDWNVVQDYNLDTCNYKMKNNLNSHKKFKT